MKRRNRPDVRHCASGELPHAHLAPRHHQPTLVVAAMDHPTHTPRRLVAPAETREDPQELTMRPCGCDWDILVFGHQYCWTTINGWKHVICRCSTCPCHCHQDSDHGTHTSSRA